MRKEALAVSGPTKKAGITVWDLETGEFLLRIQTSASPPRSLLCLPNHVLVASQLQKDRPFGCGAIFFWHLNKPQAPQVSYPMEAIGPIASSRDGVYLVGGAPSGNAYVWEVAGGKLLKNWRAHHRSLTCLALSRDDSFLISGSEDGTICIWSMISLLNVEDPPTGRTLPALHNLSGHASSVTGLIPVSAWSGSAIISSSLDGTCKVWDIVSGSTLQNHAYSVGVTAAATDPGEQLLFAGREDGKILVNVLDLGLHDNEATASEHESGVLHGHKGPITALAFTSGGTLLISASEDCTACLWDVATWQVVRTFTHDKVHITNLAVIPESSLSAREQQQKNRLRPRICSLEKTPGPNNAQAAGTLTRLCRSHEDVATSSHSSTLLNKLITGSEGRIPELIQMKIESSIENRARILSTTEQMNSINEHMKSLVVDMMQYRLCIDDRVVARSGSSRARAKTDDQ